MNKRFSKSNLSRPTKGNAPSNLGEALVKGLAKGKEEVEVRVEAERKVEVEVGRKVIPAREERIKAGLPAYRTPLEQGRDLANSGCQWAFYKCEITDCPLRPHRPYQYKVGIPPEGVYR